MAEVTYSDKLRDPRWQKKRLKIFERDNWTCVSCMRSDLSLQVHHLLYLPGRDPWEYEDHLLVTYCEFCHNTEHLIGGQINDILLELIKKNRLYIKPLSQLCTLIEKVPEYQEQFRVFVNEKLIAYLKTFEKPLSHG